MRLYSTVFTVLAILLSSLVSAAPYQEGEHYKVLSPIIQEQFAVSQLKESTKTDFQVLEFFSLGCRWCHKLEPHVQKWLADVPANTTFIRVPVTFHATWRPLAKAFFTIEALELSHDIVEDLFEAIHDKREMLTSDAHIRNFFLARNVDAEAFDSVYNSFSMNQKLKWADDLTRAYQIRAVPTLVLNTPTQSYMTSGQVVGSGELALKVIDYLADEAVAASAGK